VAEGDTIPADFDSMIAKIIAYGRTRDEALARLRRALTDTTVVIEGGATNKSFLLELLDRAEVTGPGRRGDWADTAWIDRTRADGGLVADRHAEVALVVAAVEAYEELESREVERLLDTAYGGRPQTGHKSVATIDLKLRGTAYKLTCSRVGPDQYLVGLDDQFVRAQMEWLDDVHARLRVEGERYRVVAATHGPVHLVEIDGTTHRVSRDEGGILRAPAPALVVATPVVVGDEVAAGAPVVVLESMKMETAITAPFAARIKELLVRTGTQVESMAPLVRLEPLGGDEEAEAGDDGSLAVLPERRELDPERAWEEALANLRHQVLGFDPVPGALRTYLAARDAFAEVGDRSTILAGECELFATFSDIAELSRNRPADQLANTELRIHSDREYLHTFLTTLDVERAGLPESFTTRLASALARYGVDSFDRTAEFEAAMFRVFLAHHNVAVDVALVVGVLERWLAEPAPSIGLAVEAWEQLERLKRATQLRFATLGDLARSARFRWFDQPMVDEERARIW
ncbi:MAG: fused acetyl/propionyl-CoA carboxylase subunit alpha/methylmalonyl-CoA decarboxylase subunit alpha, partial [Propionibacterium sp.]|nr:fused acetyl/propionyl-CoA carboxylase subunit alpha/methylmalonyl-CoA decarboxylase subunit alpha [Propionibacterium sp.]